METKDVLCPFQNYGQTIRTIEFATIDPLLVAHKDLIVYLSESICRHGDGNEILVINSIPGS